MKPRLGLLCLLLVPLVGCTAIPENSPSAAPGESNGAQSTAASSALPTATEGTTAAPTNSAEVPATKPPQTTAPTVEPTSEPTTEPTVEPTAEPTETPTTEPTSTPSSEWTAAELVAGGKFAEPVVAIDSAGYVHVAAAGNGSDNRGIWYFTNASGAWATKRVTIAPPSSGSYLGEEYDGEPSIALDTDGSVWIAFTRWTCGACAPNPSDGVFYVTNSSGDWSDPTQVAGAQFNSPSLVARDGAFYIALAQGMVPGRSSYPIWYGNLTALAIAQIAHNGNSPTLYVDPAGRADVLFADNDVRFATQTGDGSFDIQFIAGSKGGFSPLLSVNDEASRVFAAWDGYSADAEHLNVYVAELLPGGWSDPVLAMSDTDLTGLAVGADGIVHIVGANGAVDSGNELLYASNAGGEYATTTLSVSGGYDSALAVNGQAANVVYAVDSGGKQGVWFLVGPTGI